MIMMDQLLRWDFSCPWFAISVLFDTVTHCQWWIRGCGCTNRLDRPCTFKFRYDFDHTKRLPSKRLISNLIRWTSCSHYKPRQDVSSVPSQIFPHFGSISPSFQRNRWSSHHASVTPFVPSPSKVGSIQFPSDLLSASNWSFPRSRVPGKISVAKSGNEFPISAL